MAVATDSYSETTAGTAPIALVIDDDADIRHLLERVLVQSGFETILTANATDGVAAVEEFNPVITMLDVSMPGMDGFAAARRIREFSGTYIIMLTALADEIDVIQGLSAGADDYLLKPFRPRELRARIETLLRRPRQRFEDQTIPAPTVEAGTTRPVWSAGDREVALAETVEEAPRLSVAEISGTVSRPVPRQAPAAARNPIRDEPVIPATLPGAETASVPSPPLSPSQPDPFEGHDVVDLPVQRELAHLRAVDEWVRCDGLAINTATGEAVVAGRPVELNSNEFALLATLMESGRRVRSTANLVLTLRGASYVTTYYVNEADKSAVKAHMNNLRMKLGDTDIAPRWIETVRGVGYRMTEAAASN